MRNIPFLLFVLLFFFVISCSAVSTTYDVTKGTIKTTYNGAKLAYKVGSTTAKLAYKLGEFTFEVIMAPLDWPMTRDIETIDGLPPKEAIKQGKVKNSPYTVKGKRYKPMSVKESLSYREKGVASWYGNETFRLPGGHMTANGEAFDPNKPSAAHKLLPLPTNVKVTNLDNGRSILLRVNDRGPFVRGRVIDLSAGAAKKLGFYKKGTARVKVETVMLN